MVKRDQETKSRNCAGGRQTEGIMGTQSHQVLLGVRAYHIELWLFIYFADLLYYNFIEFKNLIQF